MGTVAGITPGSSGIQMRPPVTLDRASGSPSMGAIGSPATDIAGMGRGDAIDQLRNALVQMLQDGGGDNAQNNQMLQLLIGLMILLAILGNSQASAATADQIYEQLGAGQGAQAGRVQGQITGLYASSTMTVMIEQTSTVMAFTGSEATASQGGRLDTVA